MKLLFTVILSFLSAGLFAQARGVVTVIKDPMIDSLIAKRIALNTSIPATGTVVTKPAPIVSNMGYRVQIFYGSDRRQVYSEQSKFSALYPTLNTYITYKEPNYYLRVGDFRTRLEAQRLISELRPNFPTLFIFREKINAPNLDYDND
ncbi:SPOR domain-containing protein [Pedobacter frigoris]|uniref:SPOR domain-containing protein n=1 Tax=Pedobacter frigoris TaxID=2571272 RepID=A0A4U1CJF6_9SPHI|nr:SPOR domain-containing protein [Pedobacter frigoris]TKC07563.1 SPOR domain-containing protein [Pedobacter frigoris]